jgi:hypothetical protein
MFQSIMRPELDILKAQGYEFSETWQVIDIFERKMAEFFGSTYAIATDSCTHALELCFRLLAQQNITVKVPLHTYMSVPMMLDKIGQKWKFDLNKWAGAYRFDDLPIIDAATLYQNKTYIPETLMCISFQFKKTLPIGRGGMILTDSIEFYKKLQRWCRDGRDRTKLHVDDDVYEVGYHYHMVPEDAARGILLADELFKRQIIFKGCNWNDYRPLDSFTLYKNYLAN